MATLYEIVTELQDLENDLINAEGELTPEAEEALARLEGTLAARCEHILRYSLEQEALGEVRATEAKRLAALASANRNRADALQRWMRDQLLRLPERSVQTPLGRLQPQRNSTPSLAPRVPPEELPEEFQRKVVEANGAKALELWRETIRERMDGVPSKGKKQAQEEARGLAVQLLRERGFDAELGWHLRVYS